MRLHGFGSLLAHHIHDAGRPVDHDMSDCWDRLQHVCQLRMSAACGCFEMITANAIGMFAKQVQITVSK